MAKTKKVPGYLQLWLGFIAIVGFLGLVGKTMYLRYTDQQPSLYSHAFMTENVTPEISRLEKGLIEFVLTGDLYSEVRAVNLGMTVITADGEAQCLSMSRITDIAPNSKVPFKIKCRSKDVRGYRVRLDAESNGYNLTLLNLNEIDFAPAKGK